MGGIFISYRREDSQGEALHLCEDLKEQFGSDRVFMDVTGIDPGKDFRKAIENAVTTCDALVVMIGKDWIDAVDEEGKRRFDNPKDFVRIETAAALRRDIPVIPVLVQGAAMPRPDQLPPDMEALTWRNAFEIRHNRWRIDVAELISGLRKTLSTPSAGSSGENISRPTWRTTPRSLAMVGSIVAVIGVVALQQAGVFDRTHTIPDGIDRTMATKPAAGQQDVRQQEAEPQEPLQPTSASGLAAGSAVVLAPDGGFYSVYDASGEKYLGARQIGDALELFPGNYLVEVSGVRKPITVREGQRASLTAASAVVLGPAGGVYSIYDASGQKSLGVREIGDAVELFPGNYLVEVSGVRKPVTLREGQRASLTAGSAVVLGPDGGFYIIYDASGQKSLGVREIGDAVELFPGNYLVEVSGVRKSITVREGQQSALQQRQ
jgi:hypothetical protein